MMKPNILKTSPDARIQPEVVNYDKHEGKLPCNEKEALNRQYRVKKYESVD
jgi:hypothetical protein